VNVVLDQATTGGGTYVNLGVRRTGTSDYRARLWFRNDATVALSVSRVVSGNETLLRTVLLPGTYTPGTAMTLRVQASGSGTTQLDAKAWPTGGIEPTGWQVSTTDTTAELQQAGFPELVFYHSATATTNQVVRLDDLWLGAAGTVPARP
jgi:hypothetical protein